MNIYFVSFQGFRNGQPWGAVKGLFPFFVEINKKISPQAVYFVSKSDKIQTKDNIIEVSKLYRLICLFFAFINKFIYKIPSYKQRFIQEKLFDYFVSRKISKSVILLSSAYLVKSSKKNKKLGGINIFLAANPDDYEIHYLLKNEQKKHNVAFNDAYTYKKRIDFGSKAVFSFDHIITFTSTQYSSFAKRIPVNKISLVEHYILPREKTFPEINYTKKNILTFCFIAHPFWLKGLPYLLEAWSKINSNDIKLIVGGRIDKQMQEFIDKNYSNLKNIEYTGWINNLNKFLRTSHVCIIPSLLDAGPATVAEAMYCKLPVIVSDGCGASLIVQANINGFVVPTGNSNAITDKINWFIDNKQRIDSMGNKASKTISELSLNDQNKNVADHIQCIIKELTKK